MYRAHLRKLDNIIDKTLKTIKENKDKIREIHNYARDEYKSLQDEFVRLKSEAADAIENVNNLAFELKKRQYELMTVNESSEENIKSISDKTEEIRQSLAAQKQRQKDIMKRRNQLEKKLSSIKQVYDKSAKLLADLDISYGVITGDFESIICQSDDKQCRDNWGIKVLESQELERKRIARDMHDGPTQKLSNIIIKTELCIKYLDKDINRTKLELQSLKIAIRETIDEIRCLIHNLRPMMIDDLGLVPTIERLIDEFKNNDINFKISLICEEPSEIKVDNVITVALYRICQEALNNIQKYSQATNVKVKISRTQDKLNLVIEDNGVGFDISKLDMTCDDTRGFGISIMRERALLMSGTFNIESIPNVGTTITISIPL